VALLPALESPFRLPPQTDYGIGIVGCGGIVNYAHLVAYKQHNLRVMACYDTNTEVAHKTAQAHNIPCVHDTLQLLLADPSVEIVDIAVQPWHQRAIAEQALAAGKHILCQKPLATTLADAIAIKDAALRYARKAAVNQQMRWSAGIAAAQTLIRKGVIGQPTDAQIQVSTWTDWQSWPWLAASPRLEVLYHSIHYIDTLRALFGEPEWVTSRHSRYPNQREQAETKTITILDYTNGPQALIAVNHADKSPDHYALFRFVGTHGVIKGTIGLMYNYPHGQPDTCEVHLHDDPPERWHSLTLKHLWIPDAFIGPMASLMEAIQTDGTPITSAEDNLNTLRIVEAAYQSASEQRSIRPFKVCDETS
jgi:predicted dehydrogenase